MIMNEMIIPHPPIPLPISIKKPISPPQTPYCIHTVPLIPNCPQQKHKIQQKIEIKHHGVQFSWLLVQLYMVYRRNVQETYGTDVALATSPNKD